MRGFRQILGVAAVMILGLPIMAQAQDLIPDRRFVLSQDIDLPGGDIAQMFDTTLEACQRACLTSQKCTAFTFNTRNGSCFPKANPGEGAFFQGAFSGTVLTADPGAEARALARRGELIFLQDYDIASATQQATNLANEHVTDGWTAEEHLASAAEAEANGDFDGASRFTGAAINITDAAENWADYARLLLAAAQNSTDAQQSFRDRSVWASMNAYLRADNKALHHG
jgi:alpha-2-macroglobulin